MQNPYNLFEQENLKLLHAALLAYRNEISKHKIDALKNEHFDKPTKLSIEKKCNERIDAINNQMQLLMHCVVDTKPQPALQ